MFFNIITSNFLRTGSYNRCFPSLLDVTSFLRITFAVLQKLCKKISENFIYSARVGLAVLKKIDIF